MHLKKIKYDKDLDVEFLARRSYGFSGAALENWINEAALLATKTGKNAVYKEDFLASWDSIMIGSPDSRPLSDSERQIVAHHEAGHAVAAMFRKNSLGIDRLTIVPRAGALGMLLRVEESDEKLQSCQEYFGDIIVALAGRAAEMLKFGKYEVTVGASSDFQQATRTANILAYKLAMTIDEKGDLVQSDKNFLSYPCPEESSGGCSKFIAREHPERKEDAQKIVAAAYKETLKILEEKWDLLEKIVAALLERETLNKDELFMLSEGKELPPLIQPDTEKSEKTSPAKKITDKNKKKKVTKKKISTDKAKEGDNEEDK